jgi:hypothetical protein
MNDNDRAAERLKDHARKMRTFWDDLDKLDEPAPDAASDPFQLPYTTVPTPEHEDFKLTFPA